MNSISDFFLRAKHWLLFVLTFGLMMAAQIAVMVFIAAGPASPEELFDKLTFVIFLVTLLSCFPLYSWLWVLGSFLSNLQRPDLRLSARFFQFAIIFPLPYIYLFFLVFQSKRPEMFLVIFPLHLFAMFCIFYVMYFVAKNLAQLENARRATFSDYAGYFFLIWFYPVGVWIIQPKINRLYSAQHKLH